MIADKQIVQYFAEAVTAALWLWAASRRFYSVKPLPGLFAIPGRIFKFCLMLTMLGLLMGCSDGDPLAEASGPLFPLNVGHWQPTTQDLAAPPSVSDH